MKYRVKLKWYTDSDTYCTDEWYFVQRRIFFVWWTLASRRRLDDALSIMVSLRGQPSTTKQTVWK